jgi:biopolymer transport protein ExbD
MAFDRLDADDEVMSEINMTPLVDIMLVLLVIFLVTVPVMQQAVKVNLPQANSAPDRSSASTINLTVNAQGAWYLNDEPLGLTALEQALAAHAQRDPQVQLNLRADHRASYNPVAQALAAAHRAGLTRVAFVTEVSPP